MALTEEERHDAERANERGPVSQSCRSATAMR
jgi:hypothetical protein